MSLATCNRCGRPKTGPCERCGEVRKKWRAANPDKVREHNRRGRLKRYGITVEEYDALIELQDGACLICKRVPTESERALAVDHNHRTGEVRALLCIKCNRGLGWFNDDPELLTAAAAYLESHV